MIPCEFGTLHLPLAPQAPEISSFWMDSLPNVAVCIAALLLAFLNVVGNRGLPPFLVGCLQRKRGCEDLEHNLKRARGRNYCLPTVLLILAAVSDRFGLYRPGFAGILPDEWSIAVCAAALLAYALIRDILHRLLRPRRLKGDASEALRCCIPTFAVILCPPLALTACGLVLFGVPDAAAGIVVLIETAVLYVFSIVREFQILADRYPVLISFLYLCTLEFLPAALLIVSAVLI